MRDLSPLDDLNQTLQALQRALGASLQNSGVDVIDIVPIPTNRDRMIRLRTIEEILGDSDAGSESEQSLSYIVQVKPRKQKQPKAHATDPEITQPVVQEALYLADGRPNIPYLSRNAELLFSAGDYVLAKNVYQAILHSGERTAQALFGIGRCLEAEGKPLEAKAKYEESIAYHPTVDGYQRLAAILMQQQKDSAAAQTLERALNLKDVSAATRFEMHQACGNCWTRAQKLSEAERHYHKALELEPSSDAIRANLGTLYLQSGKTMEAERFFQEAVAANPRNAKALFGLASCFLASGEKRQAHDYFARSLAVELNNPTAIFHLVKCAYDIKSYATAAGLLEEYIASAPVNTNLIYSLAGLQYHLGRMESAQATALKILELQPQHAGATELLNLIDNYLAGAQG